MNYLCKTMGHFWFNGVNKTAFLAALVAAVSTEFSDSQMIMSPTWGGERAVIKLSEDAYFVVDQLGPANLISLITKPEADADRNGLNKAVLLAVAATNADLQGSYGPVFGAATVGSGQLCREDSGRFRCYKAGLMDELPNQLLSAGVG